LCHQPLVVRSRGWFGISVPLGDFLEIPVVGNIPLVDRGSARLIVIKAEVKFGIRTVFLA
jgi:hypothetical protein